MKLELLAWVLSFGAHAVVLEPVDLREELRSSISSLIQTFED